jgi:UDP-N-acetylglucosamine 2-epimerase (non-hydrolysing)
MLRWIFTESTATQRKSVVILVFLMKVMHVVGARPNFMKIAPLIHHMNETGGCSQVLVHTGQHYDEAMSQVFFDELEIPRPDINLAVGSGSHAWQTAQVMMGFEPIVLEHKPDWVCVPGDVNSTVACALVCSKLGIKVAHIEAGLRSFDRTMPEEINRIITDQLSDLLFTPSRDGDENLRAEGVPEEKIRLVGNIMIDTLVRLLPKAESRWARLQDKFGLREYVLATLHRPSNVDHEGTLHEILHALVTVSKRIPVLFPVHPRTRQRIAQMGFAASTNSLRLIEPLGYLDFLALQAHATVVMTDSGGVQEETTYLGIPCLTLRPNTERPVTITHGTNKLVASEREAIIAAADQALGRVTQGRPFSVPELWDGRTAERITDVLAATCEADVPVQVLR